MKRVNTLILFIIKVVLLIVIIFIIIIIIFITRLIIKNFTLRPLKIHLLWAALKNTVKNHHYSFRIIILSNIKVLLRKFIQIDNFLFYMSRKIYYIIDWLSPTLYLLRTRLISLNQIRINFFIFIFIITVISLVSKYNCTSIFSDLPNSSKVRIVKLLVFFFRSTCKSCILTYFSFNIFMSKRAVKQLMLNGLRNSIHNLQDLHYWVALHAVN